MANVVFDEDSAARIAKAVKYVEGLQNPEEPGEDEVVEQTGRTVIRGTFSGEWAKGATQTVDFTADNGDENTKDAVNYFTNVGKAGISTDCIIMLAGSEWVLVSAEPETECREVSEISAAGNVTVVTNVACVSGNLSVTMTTLSLADFATISSQNLTLPAQTECG